MNTNLLRKGVYLNECMDDWEKFNETSMSEKELLKPPDCAHVRRVCKNFEIKSLREYHDFYV